MEVNDGTDYCKIPSNIAARYNMQGNKIGKGSYGTVYSGIDTVTGEIVAIKHCEGIFRNIITARRTLREITILRQCKYPHIAKILDIGEPSDLENFNDLWIVQKYHGHDLKTVIRNYQLYGMTAEKIRHIIYQIVCSLKYLHSMRIVHRDLKPSNVLLKSGQITIIDFGLSRYVDHVNYSGSIYLNSSSNLGNSCRTQDDYKLAGFNIDTEDDIINNRIPLDNSSSNSIDINSSITLKPLNHTERCHIYSPSKTCRPLTKHVVTRWYRAPELCLRQNEYTNQIDIWSLGCIIAELLQTVNPNRDNHEIILPLFPGKVNFMLSGYHLNETSASIEAELSKSTEQIQCIFNVLGVPSLEDIEEVDNPIVKNYLQNMVIHTNPVNLEDIYKFADPDAVDLMSKMLIFNPNKRITIEEALNHPYFKDIHDSLEEEFPIDEKMDFSYESVMHEKQRDEMIYLRKLILNEYYYFKKLHSKENKEEEERFEADTPSSLNKNDKKISYSNSSEVVVYKNDSCCNVM